MLADYVPELLMLRTVKDHGSCALNIPCTRAPFDCKLDYPLDFGIRDRGLCAQAIYASTAFDEGVEIGE